MSAGALRRLLIARRLLHGSVSARGWSDTAGRFQLWDVGQRSGLVYECEKWGVKLHLVNGSKRETAFACDWGACFGYVVSGNVNMKDNSGRSEWRLSRGQYWSTPGGCVISSGWERGEKEFAESSTEDGMAIVVQKDGYKAFHSAGGPIEARGRLRYIDGCSDSVLISPCKIGDACLNALYFPAMVRQTAHTHPSIRVGVVASGQGYCLLHDGSEDIELNVGDAFVIPEGVLHSFETKESEMRVIAFHPDSDCGPSDEDHPMINKTLLPEKR